MLTIVGLNIIIKAYMPDFIPPQFIPPQPSNNSGSGEVLQNGANTSSGYQERTGELARSARMGRVIKSQSKTIIKSREEFAQYLKEAGLILVTSWVEFEKTKDFIESSYIIYSSYNNYLEPLVEFLKRYQELATAVKAINEKIKQGILN